MKINPYIFRQYDIRGVVPDNLTKKDVFIIARSYGTFLQKRKIYQAVVGGDCRLSTPEFIDIFIKGLVDVGINVIGIGMVTTPMFYFSQYRFLSNGGAMITASHNPAKFNGFKLATGFSKTTNSGDILEIKKIALSGKFFKPKKKGAVVFKDVEKEYRDDLMRRVKIDKKFKIVIDCFHGTPGKFVKKIFEEAGCQVIGYNLNIDGSFPKGAPDPTNEKLMDKLGEEVVENKADLGLMFDGDGDRIGIVDKTGDAVSNDMLIAFFAQEILKVFPKGRIVYNTLTSQIVKKAIEKAGGEPVMWLVGHSFLKEKIAETKSVFGGEISGHLFLSDNFYGYDDSIYIALRALEYLSIKKISLFDAYNALPKLISSPEIKIECSEETKKEIIKKLGEKLKKDFFDAEITDNLVIPGNDGVRVDFSDGMIIFRYSQNGPYLTIRFEAKSKKVYNKRKEYIKKMLKIHKEVKWNEESGINLDSLQ